MPTLPHLRLAGARVLLDGALREEDVSIEGGRIVGSGGRPLDLSGYWLMPGIVDLHGDGFERHLAPRPSAPFPKERALLGADAELAANGVTTAWFAQSWSWEGGTRGPDYAKAVLEAVAAIRSRAKADIRVQIRFETHVLEQNDRLLDAVRRHGVDYVVFNNHLPEGRALARSNPARFAAWAAEQRRTPEEMLAVVEAASAAGPEVPGNLRDLAARLAAEGVTLGSHDDGDADVRGFFRGIGARVCEFPTAEAAARAAREAGEPVVMGAPNVVRGGSQSGNVAALPLVAAGLCDGLVSDYYYPALSQAVWQVVDAGVADVAGAWALVSEAPARLFGLADRGRVAEGLRADLAVVNPDTRTIEATIAGGRLAYLAGEIGRRVLAGDARALAAE